MINQIEPWINEDELIQLKRVIDSTFVTEAGLTKEFEELTKKLTNSKHAISMTNGTAALYCALKALDIGPGDEVIIPDMTFIATANAVILAGAKPVLCDIYFDTLCMNVEVAEELISDKTKVIMPVHLYGQSADMEKIINLAHKHDLFIIEDAAQGVGVTFNDTHVGTFGDLGILSYYGNKTITCGEGGIVLTNDDTLAQKCYRLKNHGRDKKGLFIHEHIGFNFSFTEMQAAIGISQMKKLDRIIEKKKTINKIYHDELKEIPELKPIKIDQRCNPVYWFTSYLVDDNKPFRKYLEKNKIQTRKFFYPLHLQPCYENSNLIQINDSPVSKMVFDLGISLPSSYSLNEEQQNYIVSKIKKFFS
ncbi:MAG: aminotransferase DegT [Candidatus Marinimicrobia bacterium]|nr:aminotransferase DegT [Candidatus Neomarinimicrobiota bacterium]|tara:strand:- start:2957 stop:4045 length:1089 start_codon:yes stop_codon:yes gene_type:complete